VLKRDLPAEDSGAFPAVMRAKSHASNTALTLAARVDETNLKRQTLDRLSELVEIIRTEEMKLIRSH